MQYGQEHGQEHGHGRKHATHLALAANFPVQTQENSNGGYVPVPWNNVACAPCTSELDCRAKDQRCNSHGCCEAGECATDEDCFSQFSRDSYYRVPSFDSFGYDINPMHPQDNPIILDAACSTNPECVAYTAYGMIKYELQPANTWLSQPPIPGLPPWVMYIKKNALDNKDPRIKMTHGVKTYCARMNQNETGVVNYRNTTGVCRQCLECATHDDCPNSAVCDPTSNCCVNNPCYTATPENGEWVDGHYSRDPQCVCTDDKPFCCLTDPNNAQSAFCSETPCSAQNRVMACSYICEDPHQKFDAVVCKANQRCCNNGSGAPVCCSEGTDCAVEENQCMEHADPKLVKCPATPPFEDVFCFPGQLCCNEVKEAPPSCCNNPTAGCNHASDSAASSSTRDFFNGCRLSDNI